MDRTSMSAPPLPLLAVFAIVVFLLSLSHYSAYKEQMRYTIINLKLLLLLLPVLLVFFLRSSFAVSGGRWLHFSQQGRWHVAAFPWGAAALVVALLLLVSYHSSFQSMWFPFASSN